MDIKHRNCRPISKLVSSCCRIVIFAICIFGTAHAQDEQTTRYTVEEGDTLWSISDKLLKNPWRWNELWKQNTHLLNPHLIYPGDVLLLSGSSLRVMRNTRLPVEKRQPKIRSQSLDRAITTIDPSAIIPFLNQSIIIEDDQLEKAAYILQGVEGEIIMGKHSKFYARGLVASSAQKYQVFRIGRPIKNMASGITLAIEGVHLGSASLLEQHSEAAVLEIDDANQEIRPGDRLVPMTTTVALPHYFPRKPETPVDSRVLLIPKGVNEAGRYDIVILSGGQSNQLESGHVLDVYSDKGTIKDPVTNKQITLPDMKVATAMVFKTYPRLSYAILMEASAPVKIGDRASSP